MTQQRDVAVQQKRGERGIDRAVDDAARGLISGGGGGGAVTSVFARTGAVVAQSGDYTAAQVGAAATSHTHVVADTTGLQAALDAKMDDSQATAFGLSLLDDANAAAGRTTLGLGTAALSATGDFAAAVHTHAQADVTNLVADLAGKAATSHTHTASQISDSTAAGRTILTAADAAAQRTALALVVGTNVQAYDVELAALAGLTSAADSAPYFTGSGTAALTTVTAFARTVLDDANAPAMRGTINCQQENPHLATLSAITSAANRIPYFDAVNSLGGITDFTAFARTLVDDADAATARTTLGVVIGTNVQAQDAELAALAGLTSAVDQLPYFTGAGTAALTTLTSYMRTLLDDVDAATARTTLGITGTPTRGTTAVNFGAAPGNTHSTIAVTGQAAIGATATVRAWIAPTATADHSIDEHIMASSMMDLIVSAVTAGVGFTINALARALDTEGAVDNSFLAGQFTIAWEWS